MSNITRHTSSVATSNGVPLSRRANRALDVVGERALVRAATVRAEGYIQAEKLHEIDSLTREAMTGQAMLQRWRSTLAAGDPFLDDELRMFTDVARMAKGEIIADTLDTFCREGRS